MELVTEIELPFTLPATPEARAWLDELDWIDLHEGPENELLDIARRAPCESARRWLEVWIVRRGQVEFLPRLDDCETAI